MLRRIAATHVVLPDGRRLTNHVVELDGTRLVNHYPLDHEAEMTEWLGGELDMTVPSIRHTIALADGTQHTRLLSPPPH